MVYLTIPTQIGNSNMVLLSKTSFKFKVEDRVLYMFIMSILLYFM